MARKMKYYKFLVHAFCIILIGYTLNESSLNYTTFMKIERFLPDVKHILIWTDLYGVNEEGQRHFFTEKCKFLNCYFTKNRSLFGDTRYFDAIVFNLQDLDKGDVPQVRGVNQKFIFAANDSADKYPICNPAYDGFFNWTWTYKVDSTISYKFISVFNAHAEELGSHFPWNKEMKPIERSFQALLTSKSRAAAVFLDECKTRSNREGFINVLQKEMSKYNMTIDIFGDCSVRKCKRKTMNSCSWRLKKQYFFFLAFEDSIAEDYVSGVVLPAYENNIVPVVLGGADYQHFLPPGSYLDVLELRAPAVAKKMYESIQNRQLYHEFFRWRNHYSVRASKVLDACELCDRLNRPSWLMHRATFSKLRQWWLPGYEDRCEEENWL